jgi:hypothetical protein
MTGPAIHLAFGPSSRFREATSESAADFLRELVLLLWPAQLLAAGKARVDVMTAGLLVGVNVLMFVAIGLCVGAAATRRSAVALIYAGVCGMLLLLTLCWFAGFSLEYVSWWPLIVAMILYGIPFWLVARSSRTRLAA